MAVRKSIYSFNLPVELMDKVAEYAARQCEKSAAVHREPELPELDIWNLLPVDHVYLAQLTKTKAPVKLESPPPQDWRFTFGMTVEKLYLQELDQWITSIMGKPGVAVYIKQHSRANRAAYKAQVKRIKRQEINPQGAFRVSRSQIVENLLNVALETVSGKTGSKEADAGKTKDQPVNRRPRRKAAA